VGDLCTVTWRGEKYRVECTPSFLLSLASALASAEGVSYIDIYRELVKQVVEMRGYREAVAGENMRKKGGLEYLHVLPRRRAERQQALGAVHPSNPLLIHLVPLKLQLQLDLLPALKGGGSLQGGPLAPSPGPQRPLWLGSWSYPGQHRGSSACNRGQGKQHPHFKLFPSSP
jgi:hypothetical protein